MIKAVFDTNIYISAILFGGMGRKLLNLAIRDEITLYTSPAIILEVALKLKDKFSWGEKEIVKVVEAIGDIALLVKPERQVKVVEADPDDDRILEAALAAEADCIVTGDKHLLRIKKYKDINILSPREFLDIL